mgnify:FL=1|jgi:hypothetical protein
MFRPCMEQKSEAENWLEFDLREITGRWVSPEGAPSVRIYRTRTEGYLLEFTYNNPQAVFHLPIRELCQVRYFDLFGRIGLAYDSRRDVLLLSAYGEYQRAAE